MLLRSALAFSMLLLAAVVPQAAPTGGTGPTMPAFTVQPWTPIQLMAMPAPEMINAAIATGPAAAPFAVPPGREAMLGNALDCLTDAVYYEARSEPEDGQRAVAQVVLNRVRHPAFPGSICGVVFQGSQRSTGCQFSFTCDGSMRRGGRESDAWERAREIARQALSGYVFAPVGLATHFHTTAIHPWWASSLTRAVTIGAHIFYRWPGQWGDPLSFHRPYVGAEGVIPTPTYAAAPTPNQSGNVQTVMGVTIHRGSDSQPDARHTPGTPATTARYASFGGSGSATVRVHRSGGTVAVHTAATEAQVSGDQSGSGSPSEAGSAVTR